MKSMRVLCGSLLLYLLLPAAAVIAHGGGLDSQGGHNCNVGSCAGTYHYHNGGSSSGSGSSSSSNFAPVAPVYVAPAPVITTDTVTKERVIEFNEIKNENPDLLRGETKIKQKGKLGKEVIVFTVTYTDGVETNRVETSRSTAVKPVNEIVEFGTKSEAVATNTSDESEVLGLADQQEDLSAIDWGIALGVMGAFGYGLVAVAKKSLGLVKSKLG